MKLVSVLFLTLAVSISGCSTLSSIGSKLNDGDFAVTLGFQYATTKFIYDTASPQSTAVKVIDFAKDSKSFFGTDGQSVLLDNAVRSLAKKASEYDMSPADRMLVNALINQFSLEVSKNIEDGLVDDQARISVNAIADIVIKSASMAL